MNSSIQAKDIDMLMNLAKEHFEMSDFQTAALLCDFLLESNPGESSARVLFGLASEEMGNFFTAETQYSYAIEMTPGYGLPLSRRGELRLRRGDVGGVEDLRASLAAARSTDTFVARVSALLKARG